MRHLTIFLLAFCLSGFGFVHASADFYASSVAVEDRSTEALRQGLREALVNVLAKASGVSVEAIKQRPSLVYELQQGDKLAAQFSYHSKRIESDESFVQQLYLKASFPENKVVSLLQKGGLTFWPPERPVLNMLVLEKNGTQAEWLDSSKKEFDFLDELQSQAVLQWGFGLQLGELTEEANSAWYADVAAPENQLSLLVRMTSHADATVSGSATLLDTSAMQFLRADSVQSWFEQAISWAAKELAGRYSVQLLSKDSEVVLQFSGVQNYQQYLDVLSMVGGLDIVQHAYVLNMDKYHLNVAVSYTTRIEQLEQSLLQDARVELDSESAVGAYQLNLLWID